MAIVTGGLGHPEEPIVTAGLGLSEPAAPGAITAHMHGAGALAGVLTSTEAPAYSGGGGVPRRIGPPRRPVGITARLKGGSTLLADLDFTLAPDAFDVLVLLDLV